MPKISIVDHTPERAVEIQRIVDEPMKQMGLAGDAITTISTDKTKRCDSNEPAPYLVVCDSKAEEAAEIALGLSNLLPEEDIEWQPIGGFIAGKKPETIPPLKKGAVVYIGPNEDCTGGWSIVDSIDERNIGGQPTLMFRLQDFPLREFNWTVLSQQQAALKAQFGEQQAKSDLADADIR